MSVTPFCPNKTSDVEFKMNWMPYVSLRNMFQDSVAGILPSGRKPQYLLWKNEDKYYRVYFDGKDMLIELDTDNIQKIALVK